MNVLREVFYGIKEKCNYKAAAHLRSYGGRRCAGFMIRQRGNKQGPGPHNDGAFISFQRLLIDGGHLGIAGNDVARSVIGRQFNQDAAVLCHRQPHYCLIFRNVNLGITHQVICRRFCFGW